MCDLCYLLNKNTRVCALTKSIIKDTINHFCEYYKREPEHCQFCGKVVVGLPIIYNSKIKLCQECANKTGICFTCNCGDQCDFKTNPSNIPPIITQNIRQGNMQVTQQVKNPERIKITCAAGCKCYSEKMNCCQKEINNFCSNWKFIIKEEE